MVFTQIYAEDIDDDDVGRIQPPPYSLTEVDDQETVGATDDDACNTFHYQLFTIIQLSM